MAALFVMSQLRRRLSVSDGRLLDSAIRRRGRCRLPDRCRRDRRCRRHRTAVAAGPLPPTAAAGPAPDRRRRTAAVPDCRLRRGLSPLLPPPCAVLDRCCRRPLAAGPLLPPGCCRLRAATAALLASRAAVADWPLSPTGRCRRTCRCCRRRWCRRPVAAAVAASPPDRYPTPPATGRCCRRAAC